MMILFFIALFFIFVATAVFVESLKDKRRSFHSRLWRWIVDVVDSLFGIG